jgi:hypothetical protein
MVEQFAVAVGTMGSLVGPLALLVICGGVLLILAYFVLTY